MKFYELYLEGAYIIEPNMLSDKRGEFGRIYCKQEMHKIYFPKEIVQINHSINKKVGSIRGMHYQVPPKCESKIVKCMKGSIYDVIVDIRKDSNTFLKWHGIKLSKTNKKQLYIPEGFAHGFQVLESNTELIYFHYEYYSPECERALKFDDPVLGIKWPLKSNIVSQRDLNHPYIDDSYRGI
ncbi:MAG TPA: dTDP-4-dehydrorhamnose 3,5-epimerase [Victivallales bacterium]|nr:dTDP-4-dehydrorhamnose 3,5-epimerase [Victivallales bacterium]